MFSSGSPWPSEAVPTKIAEQADFSINEFKHRLDYLMNSYRLCRVMDDYSCTDGYNPQELSSIANGALHRWSFGKRPNPAQRVTQDVNFVSDLMRDGISSEELSAAEALIASIEFSQTRPQPATLAPFVHGFMLIWYEMTGERIKTTRYTNSLYTPHRSTHGGRALAAVFKSVDPSITTTQLGNIVRQAWRSCVLDGMRFGDLFPRYPEPSQITPTEH